MSNGLKLAKAISYPILGMAQVYIGMEEQSLLVAGLGVLIGFLGGLNLADWLHRPLKVGSSWKSSIATQSERRSSGPAGRSDPHAS